MAITPAMVTTATKDIPAITVSGHIAPTAGPADTAVAIRDKQLSDIGTDRYFIPRRPTS